MNPAPTTSTATGSRIPAWIWTLAICGLLAVGLIFILLTRHRMRIDATERSAGADRHAVRQIVGLLHGPLVELEDSYRALFVEPETPPAPPDLAALQVRLATFPRRTLATALQTRLNALRNQVAQTGRDLDAAYRWHREASPLRRQQQLWRSTAEDNLAALDHRALGLLDREHARQTAFFQQLASGAISSPIQLRDQVPDPAIERVLREFREGTRELRQLLTTLDHETEPRRLRRLRDYDTRRATDHLDSRLALLTDQLGADVTAPMRALLGSFLESLYGSSKTSDPRERLARPGYFLSHGQWTDHERRGAELRQLLQTRIDSLTRARTEFGQLADQSGLLAAHALHRDVTDLWRICLAVAIAAGMLFLVLARTVSRAARIQIRDLQQARLEAGQAVKAQSLFLANMSHEIRTPMNGVLGMAEMLEAAPLPDEQKMTARTIRTSAEALLTVINDILDFSKIQAGKLELDAADFDLRSTLEDTVDLLAHLATAKGIELLCDIDHRVPRLLHGDAGRLRQILLNLIGNAIKFTPEGEVTLHVEILSAHHEVIRLQFAVADTGVGIPPDVQSRLFRPFTQADPTTTRRFGGTGLGLTISKRLIQMMGGDIHVRSVPGEGSTFTFTLTLHPASASRPPEETTELSGRTALVVDDNQTSREILARHLATWHMGFDVAANAEEALERLREARRHGHRFDAILIDLMMPGRNGVELARAISDDPDLATTRRILLSTAGPQPHDESLDDLSLHAWLTKPVRHHLLRHALETVLMVAPKRPAVAEPTQREDLPPLQLHVLVAEDNPINQRVIHQMLRHIGCTADFAGNGREALELLADSDFDLVLMDCQMPEMDGFTATHAIRRLDGPKRSIPVIALTANVLPADRRACAEAGMNGFLPKPIKKDELRDAIASLLPELQKEG